MSSSGDPRPSAAVEAARSTARRLLAAGPVRFARMGGSSIAAPSAAGWVTDFLNAAYYARRETDRDVDDLRLAFSILTTAWQRSNRRLRLGDLARFHRAFGADRVRGPGGPTLDRERLLAGAERLFGFDFATGYGDLARSGWGVVFPDPAARAAYAPAQRLERAALKELSPPRAPAFEQRWHTYDPVELPSVDAALDILADPPRWPDFGSELGRFTPLREGGLRGQTFEIEVAARPTARTPVFTRGYVTATQLLERGAGLDEYVSRLARDMAGGQSLGGGREPLPPRAAPAALLELTTHAGHFMGNAISRVLLFEHERRAYVRDIGSWDPMPAHLAIPYRLEGHEAQRGFWGEHGPERSVLHQLALRAGERA